MIRNRNVDSICRAEPEGTDYETSLGIEMLESFSFLRHHVKSCIFCCTIDQRVLRCQDYFCGWQRKGFV
ncbi:hypothetical protein NPIL_657231 [Nephila pilipes]|uniref:Uncharacterized protein n=1 Tax=Nephila pilipes TaxID=299642 RepID=A0A8X6UN50_NEPPI|nr:hypothetical protein NPIL_657231 [Nephila pilipes]